MQASKIALVTGSSQGIGRGLALELARAGWDVGVHYGGHAPRAQEVAQEIRNMGRRCHVFQADISNLEELRRLYDEFFQVFDHIDLLVNNAGITRKMNYLDATPEHFSQVIHTNLRGTYFSGQYAARRMVKDGIKGTIINISSNHSMGTWEDFTVYAAAKGALDKLGKNIAMDLAPYGIRCVTIAPGYTQLEWFEERAVENYVNVMAPRIPMQRFLTPQEVGKAVVFLASDGAGYITGTTLYMDGGALLPVAADNRYNNPEYYTEKPLYLQEIASKEENLQ